MPVARTASYSSRSEYDEAAPYASYPDRDADLEIVAGPRPVFGYIPGEMLEIDFLPGGLTAMPGSVGNIVARRTTHTGPVYLLAENVTVQVARRVLACSPGHGTVAGISAAIDRALNDVPVAAPDAASAPTPIVEPAPF